MNNVFSDCQNMRTLDILNWDITNVETKINIFCGCFELNIIDGLLFTLD